MRILTHGGDIYSNRNIPENKKLIDFSANINPLGMPPSVKRAIIDNIDAYTNYPDPLCRELINEISKAESIPNEFIVCGNGAADLIYRIVSVVKPKVTLLLAPTFSEYQKAVEAVNSIIKYHYLNENKRFVLDESILDKLSPDVDLVFLCNPNNPTGVPIEKKLLLAIVEKCKLNNAILVVDECFIDFLENSQEYSIIQQIKDYNNVIVLKAFTKVYAMAGIRLGYCICSNSEIGDSVYNQGQPWSVSVAAQKCGIAALNETEFVNQTKIIIKQNREYLIHNLKLLGLNVYNSKANYILFKSENKNIQSELEKNGILIRSCANYKGLKDTFFRIAVKLKEDNEYLIKCLASILKDT